MVPCPVFGLPAGYWTDDGSMAMCVMDSFVRKGGYDLKDVAGTFLKWLKEGYLSSIEGSSFDVGNATYDSVMAFSSTGSLVNNSGWAVSTLDAALWAFNTTETFADGLVAAVNLGGDADTIGAVYGQIAGAYYGFDAIPERWVKAVKTWEEVDSLIERFLAAENFSSVLSLTLPI